MKLILSRDHLRTANAAGEVALIFVMGKRHLHLPTLTGTLLLPADTKDEYTAAIKTLEHAMKLSA